MINKEGIWTSPKDVTWEIKPKGNWQDKKGKAGYKVLISGIKNPEKNDSNVPLDDNEKATNTSKKLDENVVNKIAGKVKDVIEEGVQKVKMVWSNLLEEGKKFWLRWNTDDGNAVIPGQLDEKQLWIQIDQPKFGKGYFTLHYHKTGNVLGPNVLTAEQGSLQIRGTKALSKYHRRHIGLPSDKFGTSKFEFRGGKKALNSALSSHI